MQHPFGIHTSLAATDDDHKPKSSSRTSKGKKNAVAKKKSSKRKAGAPKSSAEGPEEKDKKKQELMKQLKAKLDEKKQQENSEKPKDSLLSSLNPFQAGQNLRKTLGQLTTLGGGLSSETKQKYYLDDRFLEGSGGLLNERNPYLDRQDNYVPEVLVIGATGEVGRRVVRRLLLEGKFRVRVLVRDLYSQTLNLLGTGVTYCQGDLANMESLEYALTDVDKIVFCAGAPRPDEDDFQKRFQSFAQENLEIAELGIDQKEAEKVNSNIEWEQLNSVLEVRAQLAEQVDCIGVQNLVQAYQNVRHADYGTSQAAKRSLFKFSSRPDDFKLFSLDEDIELFDAEDIEKREDEDLLVQTEYQDDDIPDTDDPYAEYDYDSDEYAFDGDDAYYDEFESRRDSAVKSQVKWIRNEFGHGVFVGKVPKGSSLGVGGEAAITSSRLRSREDPEKGIDLSEGFAGFIVRLCGDGGTYEAFVRTKAYEEHGIEYVCEFSTGTKSTSRSNKSRNKFMTARLPFESFKPVLRKDKSEGDTPVVPPFKGADLRRLGFRFRAQGDEKDFNKQNSNYVGFYTAISFVKVYRLQPEPEFVYLSDALIPPTVKNRMVKHSRRRILADEEASRQDADVVALLDDSALMSDTTLSRSPEETYFKYRGEEILKSSGLSYTIVRVPGFNESPSGEASTIELCQSNERMLPVSREDVALVCVSALLNPSALNKSVYIGKKSSGGMIEEDISSKFSAIPVDRV